MDLYVHNYVVNYTIILEKQSYGARPTKHISIEFEIRWKFRTL